MPSVSIGPVHFMQPDVLPRCWRGPSTSSIWSGRCSHISDVTLYFLAWVPCVLQVHLQFCNSMFSSVVRQRPTVVTWTLNDSISQCWS